MTLVNATPHEIKIFKEDKKTILKVIPVGDFIIRLKTKEQKFIRMFNDVPLYTNQEFTGVELRYKDGSSGRIGVGDGEMFIVSSFVKDYIDEHLDKWSPFFCVPDSNEGAVRENGVLLGTTRLLN